MRSFPFYMSSLLALSMTAACAKKTDLPQGNSTDPGPAAAQQGIQPDVGQINTADNLGNQAIDPTEVMAQRASAASSVNSFGAMLFDKLRAESPNANVVVSPWSVENALLIVAAGAQGETRAEMLRALGFGDTDPALVQRNAGALGAFLAEQARERNDDGSLDDDSILRTANAVWVDAGVRDQLRPEFASMIQQSWNSEIRNATFATDHEKARTTINEWVEDNTDDKIKDLISPGLVNPGTTMVITNAVHFDADWATEFNKDHTSQQPFHLVDGGKKMVDMMHHTFENLETWSGDDFVGVRLPYEDNTYVMDIILPNEGKLDAVRDLISGSTPENVFDGERSTERVNLWLPKFKFSYSATLNDALREMGMLSAFTGGADFGGMFNGIRQAISAVVHKVYIDVDEEGTEAAAATGVVMMRASVVVPSETIDVRVDRPFLFAIREVQTGTPVFYGQVTNPVVE